MKNHYWLCSYPLRPGSIIAPGNWGRMIKEYSNNGNYNFFIVSREYIFENVRIEKYPNLPSRLKSIFLCADEADARRFQLEMGRSFDLLYEVEIINETAPTFSANWQLANFPQAFTVNDLENNANTYWGGDQTISNQEILTESEIRILKQL